MANGYSGKILRVNLTNRTVSTLNTSDYEEWGGGHGMGSAIFWDLAVESGWDMLDGFDSRNVVTMMTSPLSGTLAPGVAGRTEVQGIGVAPYPIGWFTRSGFGGRFAAHLKYAGWDGVVIEGAASSPTWVNIVNDNVTFEDAGPDGDNIWGLTTWEAQERIWRKVTNNVGFGKWAKLPGGEYTAQRPAVVAIGQAGENLARNGSLVHDAGNGAGQGGFGGVLGSKNLKAVSVLGTGSVEIAEPEALMEARLWHKDLFGLDVDIPRVQAVQSFEQRPGRGLAWAAADMPQRASGCQACHYSCRRRFASGTYNESQCVESLWYFSFGGPRETATITDLAQQYGINLGYDTTPTYVRDLNTLGVLGIGKEIECDLPFEQYGTLGFAQLYARQIAYREGLGDDLAEGAARGAERWGRYEEDTDSGLLSLPNWGYGQHYDPRTEVEWSYGSLLGDRDINEHCVNGDVHWLPLNAWGADQDPEDVLPAARLVEILASKVPPYSGDPFMFDYSHNSDTGIYSDHRAKEIAWHRHYSRFWKQGILWCDWAWPQFTGANNPPSYEGATPEAEPMFFNAVTGKNITFADGVEIGRRIWNLDRAIWILQGRHRDLEVYTGYVYDVPTSDPDWLPVYENGQWSWGGGEGSTYNNGVGRTLDRAQFEAWKTKFIEFEGWDTSSGWPTRATLEGLDLGYVADKLEAENKLGA